jgi:uridine kinase
VSVASLLVGIAGGSGSGKTTLAQGVAAAMPLGHVVVIPHDAYYRDLGHVQFADRIGHNFDEPASLDHERLVEDLRNLRAGRAIARPSYDFATHTRLTATTRIEASPVVIVEGILVLAIPTLCEVFDLKVFVEASEPTRLVRRIGRDVAERGRTCESAEMQYQLTTRPMHDLYVAPCRAGADVVVSGDAGADKAVESVTAAILRLTQGGVPLG